MGKSGLDMTEGRVMRSLLAFSIPALLANMLHQVYTLTDNIIVGRVLGLEALAAVGVTTPVIMLLGSLIFGINNGVTILLSQAYGSRDIPQMRRSFYNSLYLGLLVAAVMAALGTAMPVPVLKLIGTPEGPLRDAASYIRISFFTSFCPMLYFLFSCAFRGMGDSRTALYCMIVSVTGNVFLDLLFVAVFGWGVAGSAWATALAQFCATALAAVLLFRKYPIIRPQPEDWRPQGAILKRIAGLAIPIALQSAFINLGSLAAQAAVNLFGELVMGAYTAAGKIGALALLPLESLGSSLSVFTGQNYGAKKAPRIRAGVRAGLLLQLLFSTALAVLLALFGRQFTALFLTDPPAEMLDISFSYLMITAVPGILAGVMFVYQQALRGVGLVRDSMYGGFVQLGVKIAVVLIGAMALRSLNVIWLAWPLSYIAGAVFVWLRGRRSPWIMGSAQKEAVQRGA